MDQPLKVSKPLLQTEAESTDPLGLQSLSQDSLASMLSYRLKRSLSQATTLPLIRRRVPLVEEQARARDLARLQRRLRRSGYFSDPIPKVVAVRHEVTDEMLSQGALDLFPVGPSLRHANIIWHWHEFRIKYRISAQVRPMWEDYRAFFNYRRDQGVHYGELKQLYHDLKVVHKYVYREKFPIWSIALDEIKRHDVKKKPRCAICGNILSSHRVKNKCQSCANKNKNPQDKARLQRLNHLRQIIKKKTMPSFGSFTLPQLEKFLKEADSGDRSLLICQAVIVVLLCGSCQLHELKQINRRDVVLVEQGYQITFQTQHKLNYKMNRKFVIPWSKVGWSNICLAEVMRNYLEDLDQNVDTANHICLFIVGEEIIIESKPKVMGVPMGEAALLRVGNTVASWLKLSDPNSFTSRSSFRKAGSEFEGIFGRQTLISNTIISDDQIFKSNLERQCLEFESNMMTNNVEQSSKLEIGDTDCDETDPLNLNTKVFERFNPVNGDFSIESDEITREAEPGTMPKAHTDIFIAEGLIFEPVADEKPLELSRPLDFELFENSEDSPLKEFKTEEEHQPNAMADEKS